MATSLPLCTNCNSRPPNTGYKWCDHCFQQSQVYHGSCIRCGNPPNPGYPLCELCFRNKTNLGRNNCVICSVTPAEPNMDLCQSCWGSMNNNTAGNQFMSNPGTPARIQFPLTLQPQHMHPLLSTVSNVLCAKCKLHPRNSGYELCETCFKREQMAVPRPYPPYHNGFTQRMMPFPMPQHLPMSPHLPMAYVNYAYRSGFQSIESSPDSQDEDAKTLLKKSSSYVNKKVVKKKPLQPTDATEHHCMCPLCYSDASRTDLFYCVHCFESVVVDASICNGCSMRIK